MTKPFNSKDFAQQFAETHPEIGEMLRGDEVSPDSLTRLSHIVHDKMFAIEKKELSTSGDLFSKRGASAPERKFASITPTLLTRSLAWVLRRPGSREVIRDDEKAQTELSKVLKFGRAIADSLPGSEKYIKEIGVAGEIDSSLIERLEAVAATTDRVPATEDIAPYTSHLADIADAALGTLSAVAEAEGGIVVDPYLEGNLQNVLMQIELVERAA